MKTVLQDLINKFEEIKDLDYMVQIMILRGESQQLLEQEKEQIIESYNKGQKDFANYDPERHGNECKDGKQYYDSNFGYKVAEAGI